MGRPSGKDRQAILGALAQGEGTSRQVAERTGIEQKLVLRALNNLTRKGRGQQVQVVRQERVRGCKRPVPVYALILPGSPQHREQSDMLITVQQLGLALFGGRAP